MASRRAPCASSGASRSATARRDSTSVRTTSRRSARTTSRRSRSAARSTASRLQRTDGEIQCLHDYCFSLHCHLRLRTVLQPRRRLPLFVADRLEAVKWRNYKLAFYEAQHDWWGPPVKLGVPKIFDLVKDPTGEYGATLPRDG